MKRTSNSSTPTSSQTEGLAQRIDELCQDAQFDSRGSFTVALNQIRTPGHADSADFLWQLVQAAHASNSPWLRIRTRGDSITVSFLSPGCSPEQLKQLGGRGHTDIPLGLRLLQTAALGSLTFEPRELMWGCLAADGGWGYRLNGSSAQGTALAPSRDGATQCFLRMRRYDPWPSFSKLQQRCHGSRIPLHYDDHTWSSKAPAETRQRISGGPTWLLDRFDLHPAGLSMPHLLDLPARLYDLGTGTPLVCKDFPANSYLQQWRHATGKVGRCKSLAEIPENAVALARTRGGLFGSNQQCLYAAADDKLPLTSFSQALEGRTSRATLGASLVLRIPARPRHKHSQIHWIQHGVRLNPIEGVMLMSDLEIWIADDQQQTDLSCLKIIDNDRFQEKLADLNAQLLQLAPWLRRSLNNFADHGLTKKWVIGVLENQNLDIRDELRGY